MRGTVAKLATLGLLAGCGLARSGLLAPSTDDPGGPDAAATRTAPLDATTSGAVPGEDASFSNDAGASSDDAASTGDGTSPDASDASDGACPPAATDAAVSTATSIAPPPTIDGNLSDWGCGPWIDLNDSNAGYVREDGQTISGQFAVRWDAANLYVAAHIVVPTLQGTNSTEPYVNDAIEMYVSGDSPLTGDYDKLSHQYVVDWHNLAVDYGPTNYPPSQAATNPPNFTSQVKVVSDGWQVEAAIAWAAIVNGKPPTAGASIGFDVQFDDGDGVTLNTQVLAIMATHPAACACKTCCCGLATDYPNCDTLCFGGLTLE